MTDLLVCAPLGIEARALRRGGVEVTRIGYGPRRAARAAARLVGPDRRPAPLPAQSPAPPPAAAQVPDPALALAGFGGATRAGLRPGDVVVASEVRWGNRAVPCPWADALASRLTALGFRAVSAPLATVRHVAGRRELAELGRAGVAAVDMESYPLALALARRGQPFVAVRVIVDTPERPLLRPGTVRAGLAARGRLRELGPALRGWAAELPDFQRCADGLIDSATEQKGA